MPKACYDYRKKHSITFGIEDSIIFYNNGIEENAEGML